LRFRFPGIFAVATGSKETNSQLDWNSLGFEVLPLPATGSLLVLGTGAFITGSLAVMDNEIEGLEFGLIICFICYCYMLLHQQ
jgi:hypothetical protein